MWTARPEACGLLVLRAWTDPERREPREALQPPCAGKRREAPRRLSNGRGTSVLEMDQRAVPSRRKAGRAEPSELLLLLRGLGAYLGRGGPPGL